MATQCPGVERCVCTSCQEQGRCTHHDPRPLAIVPLASSNGVTPSMKRKTAEFEEKLVQLINDAKEEGIPQGIIVALLHAHDLQQTQQMIQDA